MVESQEGQRPVVSIVVPAYNAAETIAETLRSLAAQTYPALEVIVVDDGSSDSTGVAAQEIVSRHSILMRYIRQTNAGQAAALNNGWSQSRGEYLGYLSADDILYPKAVETLVKFLRETGSCAVYPDYDLIDANSKRIRVVMAPEFEARALIERSVCQPGPGALFRRDAYLKTGGWNTKLRLTPDFDFWLRMSRHGSLARVPSVLAGFRVHEGSQSFAVPSEQKSEEPVAVITAYFEGDGGPWRRAVAMAWAHTLSARLHLRAGRWSMACSHLMRALSSSASICARFRFWHLLLSGALGRLRYRLQSATLKGK